MTTTTDWQLLASGVTSGQPVGCVDATRIPHRASSMTDAKAALAATLEEIRHEWFDVQERDASAIVAVLTRPTSPSADYGLMFVAAAGPLGGCGEATMFAAATAPGLKGASLVLDTTSGLIRARPLVDDGVAITMPPVLEPPREHPVELDGVTRCGRLVTVAGNTFLCVRASDLGIDLGTADLGAVRAQGDMLLRRVGGELRDLGEAAPGLVLITEPVANATTRSAVVWDGILNRGPCGTGTCARLVLAITDGELDPSQSLIHLSPFGESFHAALAPGSGTRASLYNGLVIRLEGRVSIAERRA